MDRQLGEVCGVLAIQLGHEKTENCLRTVSSKSIVEAVDADSIPSRIRGTNRVKSEMQCVQSQHQNLSLRMRSVNRDSGKLQSVPQNRVRKIGQTPSGLR